MLMSVAQVLPELMIMARVSNPMFRPTGRTPWQVSVAIPVSSVSHNSKNAILRKGDEEGNERLYSKCR